MRLRKAELRGRVKADLALRFTRTGLTSFAGLELVRRYFRQLELARRIRRHLGGTVPGTDYGVVGMVMVLLALLIVGGRRVRHVGYLIGDPLVARLTGLTRLPAARTIGRWLAQFRTQHLRGLTSLNAELVAAAIERLGLKRLTIDVDGSVVSTGLTVAWAQRGFNPHRRKVPSYYPITAYEAQSGQMLRVQNRPGNIHDGKASLGFLRALFTQLAASFGGTRLLEFRMDGAFFRHDVLTLLEAQRAEYAIKVPFFTWTGLKALVQAHRHWTPVNAPVSCFERELWLPPWERTVRVVIYRTRVQHETHKNFQLDLFDPADGHYEYSAVVTNKTLSGRYLWSFMCGRGGHEKAYGELKSGFAFASVPSFQYAANSAWQLLSVLAFNLMRSFQVAAGLTRRPLLARRRPLFAFQSIHTLRYELLHRAGLVLHPAGKPTLDVGTAAAVRHRFLAIDSRLPRAA
jgi:Transposase DDE domain group 1